MKNQTPKMHARARLFRRAALLLGAAIVSGWGNAAFAAPDLMPLPASVQFTGQSAKLSGGVTITWAAAPTPFLERAAARFQARLVAVEGPAASGTGASLALRINVRKDPDFLSVKEKEAYHLDVTSDGVTLSADGPAGVVHGLATLLQLVQKTPGGATLAGASIDDAPRFAWRGLMIDVSRHFMSVETIKRQLDAMELTKFNVLHWHLSDGTGFRVESLRFPRLQEVGGHHQYYTQAQIHDIVSYAGDRGIRIVPEFDIPGHTLSILEAYPELAAVQPVPLTKGWHLECATAAKDNSATANCAKTMNLNTPALDPTRPQTLKFATELFQEMGSLFPDRYFHAGGDEVSPSQWTGNPQIQAYMKAHGYATPAALQAAFTADVEKALSRQGKIMMGWDEVSEAPIPKDVVVEAWRGSKWIGSATKAGHPVVVSSGYYLDLLRPAREHYAVDPFDTKADGMPPADVAKARAKMGPMIDAFALDPDAPALDAKQQSLVLGGEAPLWSEIVSDQMVDARLWPRSAAIAERYWSPESVRDVDDMERRLPAVLDELEATGLLATQRTKRMIALLTPANITPVTVLTSVTSPVRNYAMNRLAAHTGDEMLTAPAAIASPDSLDAIAFNRLAVAYASGDRSGAAALREALQRYAGNDAAYATLTMTPALHAARPVSQALSALALLGLEAMQGGHRDAAWHAKAEGEFAAQDAAEASCASHMSAYANDLPPSGLLIDIVPGIKALVGTVH